MDLCCGKHYKFNSPKGLLNILFRGALFNLLMEKETSLNQF